MTISFHFIRRISILLNLIRESIVVYLLYCLNDFAIFNGIVLRLWNIFLKFRNKFILQFNSNLHFLYDSHMMLKFYLIMVSIHVFFYFFEPHCIDIWEIVYLSEKTFQIVPTSVPIRFYGCCLLNFSKVLEASKRIVFFNSNAKFLGKFEIDFLSIFILINYILFSP